MYLAISINYLESKITKEDKKDFIKSIHDWMIKN